MSKPTRITLSAVIPLYNEQASLKDFHTSLKNALQLLDITYEIIYVNDGSTDTTLSILTELTEKDDTIRVVSLSRNFGKELATSAGIVHARGNATVIMDGDGQHPPKLIGSFLQKWRDGAQVVIGVRATNQKEGFIKKTGSKLFYGLFNMMSDSKIVPRSTDYRLIDAVVQAEFSRFQERRRITRGLIDWLGYKRDYVAFDAPARLAGEANYKVSKLVKLAMDSFVSLSLKPLYVFGWVGIFVTFGALLAGLFILIEQFILGDPLSLHFSGAVILGIAMSFMIGLVLISQGVLAIYLSHIHSQTQGRPLYVVDKSQSINLV